ncbi:MAG: TatD family hydrolase [Caldisericota bacterium]|nr:TatD family hydrolase [Caldisericota bacterium]
MYIDSHAHLLKKEYGNNLKFVIEDSEKTLFAVNNIAYNMKSSREVVSLSQNNPLFGSVGIHPYDAFPIDKPSEEELATLASYKKIIAIGEIGLDYFRNITSFSLQKKIFKKQIIIAKSLNMPFIVHSRNAFDDTISIITSVGYLNGVFHSFDYGPKEAKKVIDLGMYISFSGMLTFKKRENLREAAKIVPINKVLLETDSPYLAPVPERGKKNLPIFVKYIYAEFANLRNISQDELQCIIVKNFKNIFQKSKKILMKKEALCLKS